jgi:hypothetical protein
MIIIAGLIVLIAAVVVGVAAVLGNRGDSHALVHQFAVFGYHVHGSEGRLFSYGIVVGAVAVAGLSLLLAAARRTSRRGRQARRKLRQSRQETAAVTQERDDLIGQRETARATTASTPANGTPRSDPDPGTDANPDPDDSRRGGLHRFRHRRVPRQAAAGPPEQLNGQAAADVPADAPAP